jgi:hypothetical protein
MGDYVNNGKGKTTKAKSLPLFQVKDFELFAESSQTVNDSDLRRWIDLLTP